jgi:hypothetical protein
MTAVTAVLTARETIFHFFRSLPIMIFGTFLLLGTFQGNINFILFAVGLGLFAPTTAVIVNILTEFLLKTLDDTIGADHTYWLIKNGASATLFETMSKEPLSPMNSVPTVWMVMTTFIYSYLFLNAYDIYNRAAPKWADPVSLNGRKTRCAMSMFIICVLFVVTVIGRMAVTHAESILGLIIGSALGAYTGYAWYVFLRNCGMGQFDDIFGITNRLLSREASGNSAPKVCVPSSQIVTSAISNAPSLSISTKPLN